MRKKRKARMIPVTKVRNGEIDGTMHANKAAGSTIGMKMEAGNQEDGLKIGGEIRVGRVADGRLIGESGLLMTSWFEIGEKNSGTVED